MSQRDSLAAQGFDPRCPRCGHVKQYLIDERTAGPFRCNCYSPTPMQDALRAQAGAELTQQEKIANDRK